MVTLGGTTVTVTAPTALPKLVNPPQSSSRVLVPIGGPAGPTGDTGPTGPQGIPGSGSEWVAAADHNFLPGNSAAVNGVSLQTAVDAAVAVGGVLIITPSLTEYQYDTTITWDAADGGLTVIAYGAIMEYTGSGDAWDGQMQTSPAGQPSWSFLGGHYIGNSGADACFHGIDVRNGRWLDVEVEGFTTGTAWWFENEGRWCERNDVLRCESRDNQHVQRLTVYETPITSVSRASNVATLTVGAGHRWRDGDHIDVEVLTATTDSFDTGDGDIITAGATTITYANTGANEGPHAVSPGDGTLSGTGSFARTIVNDLYIQGGTSGEPLFDFQDASVATGFGGAGPYDSMFANIRGNFADGAVLFGLTSAAMGGTVLGPIGLEAQGTGPSYLIRLPAGTANGARPMLRPPFSEGSAIVLFESWPTGTALTGAGTVPGQKNVFKSHSPTYSPIEVYVDDGAAPDTQPRFRVRASGSNQWGPGGSTSPDSTLERSTHAFVTGSPQPVLKAFTDATLDAIIIGTPLIIAGAGTPESAVRAPVGSLFLRTDGGAATTLYVKESGTANTGWIAK